MASRLTDSERRAALPELAAAGWGAAEGREAIRKVYVFRDFVEAFGFMAKAALWAEKLDHHPEWFNVYKTVDVTLATHDAGGLTALDLTLARHMDRLAGDAAHGDAGSMDPLL